VVDEGDKERIYSGREGEIYMEEGDRERMLKCQRGGGRERKRGGVNKEFLSV
jgi:hypothetical protein